MEEAGAGDIQNLQQRKKYMFSHLRKQAFEALRWTTRRLKRQECIKEQRMSQTAAMAGFITQLNIVVDESIEIATTILLIKRNIAGRTSLPS